MEVGRKISYLMENSLNIAGTAFVLGVVGLQFYVASEAAIIASEIRNVRAETRAFIERYDRNTDGILSASEIEKMIGIERIK